MQLDPADVPRTITCVECGETAHLLTKWVTRSDADADVVDDPPVAGDIVSYRCAGCADLFYVELPEPEA